jgi:hypothetical protein
LCDVLGDGVVKTHDRYRFEEVRTIATVRDFRDATVSDWRTTSPDHEIMSESDIREFAALMLIEVATFESYLGKGNVRVLRYEDLMQSPEMMFNGFEVSAARASHILSAHSLDENRRVAERFRSFDEFDATTHIHGRHIHSGRCGMWRESVDEPGAILMEELLRDALTRHGY